MKNLAREKFLPMLSPYVDGELGPEERVQVEQHLANNPESAAQVADFRAADGLIRNALDLSADDVDWKAFTEGVMARVVPEKLPLFERLKLTVSELFTYQRGPFVAGLVGAAAAIAVAVPLTMKLLGPSTPEGFANPRVQVQTVSVETGSPAKPVVMETDNGDAVIWVVDSVAAGDKGGTGTDKGADGGKKKKKDGEEGEEELNMEPEKKQGDL
jgi:anti-sigma factor RsiW